MIVLFSYLKFALGAFFLFASFFVLSLFYVYPYIWYFGLVRQYFKQAKMFSLRFSFYFLLNNLITPLITYLVSITIMVVGSKIPTGGNSSGGMTEVLVIITMPMTLGFFFSPFIAFYYNFYLLDVEERTWLQIILFALLTIICYLIFYHMFQMLINLKTTQMILDDFGRV